VERVFAGAYIAPVVNVLATNAFALRVDVRCDVDQSLYGFDWRRACVRLTRPTLTTARTA
jgi:hypothetical protein